MTDEFLHQLVLSKLNIVPYKMFDDSERLSLINSAYTYAYMSYQIGVQSFVDYACMCIYRRLDQAKHDYYAQCRVESPVTYEDALFQKESPIRTEDYVILQDFLQRLPEKLHFVASGYINKLTIEDVCELLGLSKEEALHLNAQLCKFWNRYNK